MRLPHGYRNQTFVVRPGVVEKRYVGPDPELRQRVELAALRYLGQILPVPCVLNHGLGWTQLEFIVGRSAQDEIEGDQPDDVLRLTGRLLRHVHAVDTTPLADVLPGTGRVLVHGDFGVQNIVVAGKPPHVSGLLDWEFAHLGDPLEDLAWAEWIVRMHHPTRRHALRSLFDAYGSMPAWGERHHAMLALCAVQCARAERDRDPRTLARWEERTRLTEVWLE